MFEIKIAGLLAAVLGGVTIITTIVFVPKLIGEIQDIRAELDAEMGEFRVLSKDLWRTMVTMDGGDPVASRQRRQNYGGENYGGTPGVITPPGTRPPPPIGPPRPPVRPPPPAQCSCNANNNCPAGPAGPKGPNGDPGEDGKDGKDGEPGIDAEDVDAEQQQFGQCFTCPMGQMGPPGARGRSGPR